MRIRPNDSNLHGTVYAGRGKGSIDATVAKAKRQRGTIRSKGFVYTSN